MSAALVVRNLTVTLGGTRLLDHVDVDVEGGAWLGIIGPNGAGKTTLLRCLTGGVDYLGSIRLAGRDTAGLSSRQRAQIVAAVPQDPVFPEGMSVDDYVLLGRTPHISLLGFEGAADRRIVAALLDELGLTRLAPRPITTLSGGERQRAVIARALAQEPSVLLLDEPTAGLDLSHQHEVLTLVDELRLTRPLTVVSALHDLTLAAQYAERFLLLHKGVVVSVGTATDVLKAELLERCYGTPVSVIDHDDTIVIVPPRPRPRRSSPTPR